ncbi:unnamed protein product, partial [Polarella glacialis]
MAPQDGWGYDESVQEVDGDDGPDIGEMLEQVRTQVFQRRIRIKAAFVDFDPRRTSRVTKAQFARALSLAMPLIKVCDVEALADHFTEAGPKVLWPKVVNYIKFCECVDEVFGPSHLENTPTAQVPLPGASLSCAGGHFKANMDAGDQDRISGILNRVAFLAKNRGY